ncbi:biotin-protein ligase [Naematelia encephala]|uniref:Biotin-protein ligase n=1 Tax=Naematelia encephala TaxID=71784 RepID=A0A1Y2AP83_9TREE|nr:biotin-protein ligase [Naematelia encephala]
MPGPNPSAHQVLVYSGPGVSPLSLSHTILTLSLLLLPHYTVQPITPQALSEQPWEPSCALLVIPGGRDLPFVEELTIKTKVTRRIKEYVELGGRYLGICAGAYFGAEEVRFDTGGEMEVVGKRDLAFFPGACKGPTFPGFAYAAESGSRAVSLVLSSPPSSSARSIDHLYYNGGGHFILPQPLPPSVQVLAEYVGENGAEPKIAAVLTSNGKGKTALCSVHFEYPLNDPPARDAIARLNPPPDKEDIERSEKDRVEWAEEILVLLGLTPPRRRKDTDDPLLNIVEGEGEEDASLLLHPTHPSPVFVIPHPQLPQLGEASFKAKVLVDKWTAGESGWNVLRDGNDELHVGEVRATVGESSSSNTRLGVTAYLAKRRRTAPVFDPAIEQLSLQSSEPTPPQPPDFHSIPKTIILPSASIPYSASWTPLFNFDTYWTELDAARKGAGRKTGVMRNDSETGLERQSLGDLVWYGETVTSTQTMLDRNPLLLTHLPAPLVFLASFQLSGRGRGSNIWLSPPGCLQFSLLLTLPSHLSSKLVFIQYLMALAVCEAVDDDGRLGVRIKWPNDIYAEVEGVGGTEVGSGKKGKAKLGGILVNTNFVGGQWRIVVGCGINILNALPTTSLSQLHSLLTSRATVSGTTSRPLPAAPTMEGTFARIMNSFESKWDQFIENKGFHGFMDEYHGRWLHTDQEVTLTTTEPHTKLRIKSITPDHGLLRCIPLTSQTSTSSRGLTPLYDRGDYGDDDRVSTATRAGRAAEQFVDLQPDGNSFDLMSGLIKRKT